MERDESAAPGRKVLKTIVIDKRQKAIDQKQQEADQRVEALDRRDEEITTKLTEVSGMSIDVAREELLQRVSEASQEESAHLRRTIIERAETDARRESREITVMAIQRFAAEHVAETTVRSVKIPSDDMKGRIIGREGRNNGRSSMASGWPKSGKLRLTKRLQKPEQS